MNKLISASNFSQENYHFVASLAYVSMVFVSLTKYQLQYRTIKFFNCYQFFKVTTSKQFHEF